MSHSITIDVKPSLHKHFQAAADHHDLPLNEVIESALEDYVEQQSYNHEIALQAYEQMKSEKAFVSGEAVLAWVKSWGTENQLPPPEPDVFRS